MISGQTIVVSSPAKLNLTFEIKGALPNGYHQVETLMQAIDLIDELRFECKSAKESQIELVAESIADFPLDQSNLIAKAFHLFESEGSASNSCLNLKVKIEKNIPIAAGLAGGSGNAAATLVALNEYAKGPLDFTNLRLFASKLGADVPFCLTGGTQVGRGRGDELSVVESQLKLYFLVIKPRNLAVSTAWAYQAYDEFCTTKDPYKFVSPNLVEAQASLAAGNLEKALASFGNVLQPVVFAMHSELAEICQHATKLGAPHCQMTGSGPTLFACLANREAAHKLRRELQGHYDHLDYFICESVNHGVKIIGNGK